MVDRSGDHASRPITSFDWKRGIMVGVISGLIVFVLVGPTVNFIDHVILPSSNSAFAWFVDSVYRGATRDSAYTRIILLGSAFFFFLAVAMSIGLAGTWRLLRSLERRVNDDDVSPEETLAKIPDRIRRMKMLGIANWVGLVLVWLITLSMIVGDLVRARVINDFEQTLAIVAPALSEQREEEIMAKFKAMDGRQDYLAVQKELRQVAEENSIKLPSSLIEE